MQANPLNVPRPSLDILGSPRILFAAAPLVVPMTLRLSSLSLRAIVVLVVSRQKGITLVFKNDPLESVNVSSSFDGVESVAGYIQRQIEHQLREAFRSDLPGVIHRLSQKWLSGEVKSATAEGPGGPGKKAGGGGAQGGFEKDAKIETRTAYVPGREGTARGRGLTTRMGGSVAGESVSIASDAETSFSTRTFPSMGRPTRRPSATPPPTTNYDGLESVPESIESYDPTYGLRPDSIPLHAGFADYERLVRSTETGRGLGDILPDSDEEDFDHDDYRGPDDSYDLVGLHDLLDDGTPAPHWRHSPGRDEAADELPSFLHDSSAYETIPAVGGGTITRPRVFHTQSQMRNRTASSGSLSAHGSPSTTTIRPAPSTASTFGAGSRPLPPFGHSSTQGPPSPHFHFPKLAGGPYSSPSIIRSSSFGTPIRPRSAFQHSTNLSSSNSTSLDTTHHSSLFPSTLGSSYSSAPTSDPPSSTRTSSEDADPSFPPTRPDPLDLLSSSPSSGLNDSFDSDLPITLNPSRNDSCAHLATLTSSNQTLSPFTRAHEHFTARSSPHVINRLAGAGGAAGFRGAVPGGWGGGEAGGPPGSPVKANRKRIHRLASAGPAPGLVMSTPPPSRSVDGGGGVRIAHGFPPGLVPGNSTGPPSEMSDYFPVLKDLKDVVGRRAAGFAARGIRRDFMDADRY